MTEFFHLLAPIMKEVFTKRTLKHNFQNYRVTLLSNLKTKKKAALIRYLMKLSNLGVRYQRGTIQHT